jgi:acetyl-CoA synthetase
MTHIYPVPTGYADDSTVTAADYQRMYAESVADSAGFWRGVAERIDWYVRPTRIRDVSFDPDSFRIRWYEDGVLNVSVNCLDRQLARRGDKTALLFEGDESTCR